MTENGKIFLVKNEIYNIFAKEEFSIGLSLYILQDIKKDFEKMYNEIVQQELLENQKQLAKKETKEQQQTNNIQKKEQKPNITEVQQLKDVQEEQEIIDMTNSGIYPIAWIPGEEDQNNSDQAD